jgi:methyl coenzyme M reductase subunit D
MPASGCILARFPAPTSRRFRSAPTGARVSEGLKDKAMAKKVTDIASLRLRKRVRTGKIILAPQSEVEKFDPDFIDDFLDRIFECSGALVTDETRLSDFVSFGNDPGETAEALAKVKAEYGIAVDIHDLLFEVLGKIAR